jgi:N-acetylglucosaminyldiphosphoundecaprenol N-acetyl-beta-D-mannosaminyltransferase
VLAIELRDRINAAWIVTCGGCFNFVTGAYGRAPQWMQSANLEWLHRLATNPRKLFWRYVVSSPHALLISVASLWRAHRARRIDADS